jgi:biopolymer transport protein ExbD
MARKRSRESAEVNSSSMADIAFLLLVFFLVTTTIPNDKGLLLTLPPKEDQPEDVEVNERNVFAIKINSSDKLLVEGEPIEDPNLIRDMVREFVLNPNNSEDLSESPDKAVVSIKNNRGSSYETFIAILDNVQGAYYDMYSERVGLTPTEFRNLDRTDERQKELYDKGREGIPMLISIARPN